MAHVKIVQLGPLHGHLNLREVASKANGSQAHHVFHWDDDAILHLKDPTEDSGRQYSFAALADRLGSKRGADAEVLVGVTDHPIYDELYSAVTSDLRCIVISTADIEEVIDAESTSVAGYVLFEISAQLLTIEYRRLARIMPDPEKCCEPWHLERRSCMFDYDEERKHTGKKMAAPSLCKTCQALLYEAGVAESLQIDTLHIAKAGMTPILTVLRIVAKNPMALILFGAWLGHVTALEVLSKFPWWLQPETVILLALVGMVIRQYWKFSADR